MWIEVLNNDNTINRKKLGEIVFNNPSELKKLNSYTHPYVIQYVEQLIEVYKENNEELIVIESALLFDTSLHKMCSETWYVYTDIQTRIDRLIQNRNYTKEEAENIIKNQKNETFYKSKATLLFNNTTLTEVEEKLNKLLRKEAV